MSIAVIISDFSERRISNTSTLILGLALLGNQAA
jgi:hypothetical protein